MRESMNEEVTLGEICDSTFKLMLKYAYTGCVEIEVTNLQVSRERVRERERECGSEEMEKNGEKWLVLQRLRD